MQMNYQVCLFKSLSISLLFLVCPGDIIDVTQEIDEGWWVGKIQGTSRTGMFPSNYTEYVFAIYLKFWQGLED